MLSQPLLAGVFPLTDCRDGDALTPEDLVVNAEDFRNLSGMDSDDHGVGSGLGVQERGLLEGVQHS